MDLEQFALQSGIAGAVLIVVYRIAIQLIANYRDVEKERTKAIADELRGIADRVRAVADKVTAHSEADLASHGDITGRVARIEAKLDLEAVPSRTRTTQPVMRAVTAEGT